MSAVAHPHEVICQICSKTLSDPRMLPCLHCFCFQCLEFKSEKAGPQQSIQCPTCLRNVSVPVGGASILPQNLHLKFVVEVSEYMSKFVSNCGVSCTFCVNGCTDPSTVFCCSCTTFLCKAGLDSHRRVPQLSHHNMIELDKESSELPTLPKRTEIYCSQPSHETKELDLYCNTCCKLICNNCIIDFHRDHNITPLCIIAEAHRDDMKHTLQCAQETASNLAGTVVANEKMMQQVESSKQEAESAIEYTFRQLMETLEERKKAMLYDLHAVSHSKVTALVLQKEQLEKMQQDIGHHPEVISHILQMYTDHEVVALGGLVPTELKAILKKAENIPLIPSQQSYLKFSVDAEPIVEKLSEVGEITELSPSPHNSKFELQSVVLSVYTTYTIRVETMSSNGERYPCGGIQVKAELKPNDGPIVSGEVEDHSDGTYSITLTPQIAGMHELHVTMDGQQVQQSPCDVTVKGDYTMLCNPEEDICVSGGPYDVAIHENGDVYVVSGDDQIYVFDKIGHQKRMFGNSGSGKGQFTGANGISIKGDVVYCADCGNHRIQKLTIGGKYIHMFGKKGSSQGQFNEPWDVIVDSEERIIVSDSGNNRIQVFNQDGGFLQTIDGSGSGDHAFTDPRGLALDPEGNIHVAARGSDAVKVFTPGGTYIRMVGDLQGPIGIAVDEKGYSFVCEERGNCLSIFDPKGIKIHKVGNLNSPYGIALDIKSGSVFIANFGSGQVLKYVL